MERFKILMEKYEPLAGQQISESLVIAKQRTIENNSIVLLRFNDIDIFVASNADIEFLEKYYYYKLMVQKYEDLMLG